MLPVNQYGLIVERHQMEKEAVFHLSIYMIKYLLKETLKENCKLIYVVVPNKYEKNRKPHIFIELLALRHLCIKIS
jgi:hypothetical protein